ncbi:MAG TPA: bifunctional oligoribonuclease/PAP phosphatase NrnA [Chthoniobacterales bacterium]|nr:bifunctional oligoribonuclease/PAP phosphatase NrnA [Chthoniobacterales bacterium]
MNASFSEIAGAIRRAHRIVLLSHIRPDGDAIGSQLALALSLESLGKEVVAWNEDGLPESYRFLEKGDLIHKPPAEPQAFDLAIALDTATRQRLGTSLGAIRNADRWINIDHHASNPGYGDLVHIDTGVPATGQIVYEFLRSEDLPCDLPIAVALYAAISTDTGSFRYPRTTARTFEIASQLVEMGVDAAAIAIKLYESYPKRRIQLLGEALQDTRFDANDRVASMSVTNEMKNRLGIQPEDVEGLIDTVRTVESVMVAIFFEELPDGKVRLSMRSKDDRIDVNKICGEFDGGGHLRAAGARISGGLEVVRNKVLERVCDEVTKSV